ncbi:Uncharacterized protein Fot_29684 [Forsythia ovata]|uniref:Uncharacterized protein n=1 Tax=Forsythia ovata TaxID=205694 RepID=A0ABD1TSL6_9LAMI
MRIFPWGRISRTSRYFHRVKIYFADSMTRFPYPISLIKRVSQIAYSGWIWIVSMTCLSGQVMIPGIKALLSQIWASFLPTVVITLGADNDSTHFHSADSLKRAFQILDQIPRRATGAYSHSQGYNCKCLEAYA